MRAALTPFEEVLMEGLPKGELANGFAASGLPTRRAEAWKWSDLRAALKGRRAPSAPYNYDQYAVQSLLPEIAGMEICIGNGTLRSPDGDFQSLSLRQHDPAPSLWPHWPVASLASAAPMIDIEVAETLAQPLFVRRLSNGDGFHADRVRIYLAERVSATIIETHEVEGSPFANSLSHFFLSKGASLTRIVIQPGADAAVLVHSADALLSEGATLRQLTLSEGAALARHETAVSLSGRSDVIIDGVYRLDADNHCDMTSHVDHAAAGCTARQLVKGVVADKARAVFQGKFFVDQIAQQTDAQMAHHAILLNDGASVNAKPELEIYADDVECAHGNTVGALDVDALFYLQQRGVPLEQARSMLIDAFYAEVFDHHTSDPIGSALRTLFMETENEN
ncbi:MAG: Fe-S cluster assembly protein SufD [Parvularcula sp.]